MTRVLGTPIVWHFVPDEWKPRLRAYLVATRGEDRDLLSAGDFDCQQSVRVRFDDGSFALFHYAFAIFDATSQRRMVFTEHCGYHVFPVGADGIKVTRAVPTDGTPDA